MSYYLTMQTVCLLKNNGLDTSLLQKLVRYEAGKLVTELFPYEKCFAL